MHLFQRLIRAAAMLLAVGCGARAHRPVARTQATPAPPVVVVATEGTMASGPQYICGVAILGYGCDNGRSHYAVVASTMSEAIAQCRALLPVRERELCYVRNAGAPVLTDANDCVGTPASWRALECCNFRGTLSCP